MNGFELSEKILKLDLNVKVYFMSAGEVNHGAIREIHPSLNIGCFIQKPVTIDYLIESKSRVRVSRLKKCIFFNDDAHMPLACIIVIHH
jgi:hypothetical protein